MVKTTSRSDLLGPPSFAWWSTEVQHQIYNLSYSYLKVGGFLGTPCIVKNNNTYISSEKCLDANTSTFQRYTTKEQYHHNDVGESCCKIYSLQKEKVYLASSCPYFCSDCYYIKSYHITTHYIHIHKTTNKEQTVHELFSKEGVTHLVEKEQCFAPSNNDVRYLHSQINSIY